MHRLATVHSLRAGLHAGSKGLPAYDQEIGKQLEVQICKSSMWMIIYSGVRGQLFQLTLQFCLWTGDGEFTTEKDGVGRRTETR